MNEGRELWKEYCGFLDKSFSEQLEYNEKKKEEHFEKWKHTKTVKQLCPEGVEKFEDIPITTYEDYPILHEFSKKMEHLSQTLPRKKGERMWDYYDRITREAAPMLNDWMPYKYARCMKTSGTGGESKWFLHGEEFFRHFNKYSIAAVVVGCSDRWGDTKIRRGDKAVHMMAPPPYGTASSAGAFCNLLNCVPSNQIMENMTDMRKKLSIIFKTIEEKRDIAYMAALPSILYLISQYLTTPAKVFKDKYDSMNPGIAKFVLYLKYLQSKLKQPRHKKVSEIVSLKGMGIGGTLCGLYLDPLREQYSVEPLSIFGTSESGIGLIGCLKCKQALIPLLETNYFEFMIKNGEIKKVDELEKGNTYTLIATCFGTMLVRYNTGDIFRIVDFEDNGLPMLSFESRVADFINIYGYLDLSERLANEILIKAGLKPTDTWTIAKLIEPSEHLLLLMEKEWDYSEEEASRAMFNALKEISEDFRNLIRDFKIERPGKFIEVEYLPKGAFMRYTMKKAKEGVPLGQMKPLKLINPEQSQIIEVLRRI